MQDFVLVQLLHRVHQLHELVPDLLFVEEFLAVAFVLDQLAQVTPVRILHLDQVLIFQFVGTLLVDDVGVVQLLQDFNLLDHAAFYFSVF